MESPQASSSRHKPIRVAEAWNKLVAAGKVLKLLGSLSDGEVARVTEAVEILQMAQISQRRRKYKLLLHSIHGLLGPQGVLLCAVALGQVKAVDMKSSDRTGLITRIETNKNSVEVNHPAFQALAVTHEIPNSINDVIQQPSSVDRQSTKRKRRMGESQNQVQIPEPTAALTGDVYELTFQDVQAVITSDQIRGRMWLTDTYDVNTSPFITIPISRKLRDQFTSQRLKTM
ncbi:hypothetical protein IFR04_012623 [Cadophora malorum]|uniref:Uncharacterized protein n=1 Tax=Cadophora malorum TaxID=108018 RepID=A0A8H7W1C6_9HELO|nr:hypothetical protein IFR04_012623 [Cadophora malorum]